MLSKNKGLLHQRIGESGLTVTKLSKECGIHRNTLNNLINGKKVNLQSKSIMKIVMALNLSSEDIILIFHPYYQLKKVA